MPAFKTLLALALALGAGSLASAFYIPSMGPQSFRVGERVPLSVNRVFSEHVPLPFAYYDLPFVCKPSDIKRPWLNIGEVLRGDRIASSDYELTMGQNETCRVLCTHDMTAQAALEARRFVMQNYLVEWIVDKLPGATVFLSRKASSSSTTVPRQKVYEPGFPIGRFDAETGSAYLNNHVSMHIVYETRGESRHIVGFEVYPRSIANGSGECPDLDNVDAGGLLLGSADKATFSYSVHWIEDSSVRWSHRWDRYLSVTNPQVHWYAIFNSAVIIILLSCIVAVIVLRMLNRDLTVFRDEEFRDDIEETSGWKLLHADVFRAPRFAALLAPLLGTTVQVMYTFIATVALGTLGILSPS
ncbi:hypothetical protein FB639_003940 [Coemansia asiatica]|nr:hypothetical protein FB639_003940 [Coemansia asiatica]